MRMTRRDPRLTQMRATQRDHDSYLQKQRDASPMLGLKSNSAMSFGVTAAEVVGGGLLAGWLAGRTGTTGIGSVQIPAGLAFGGIGVALALTGVLPPKIAPHVAALSLGAIGASGTMWAMGMGSQAAIRAGAAPAGVVVAGAPPAYVGCPEPSPYMTPHYPPAPPPPPAAIGYRAPAPPVPAHMLPLPRVQGTLTESELQAMAHALPVR